jgi:hypothetical protein
MYSSPVARSFTRDGDEAGSRPRAWHIKLARYIYTKPIATTYPNLHKSTNIPKTRGVELSFPWLSHFEHPPSPCSLVSSAEVQRGSILKNRVAIYRTTLTKVVILQVK